MAKALKIEDVRRALERELPLGSSDFDLNPDIRAKLPPNRKLRPAAVLMPLVERSGALWMILTRRSARLKHHPGQIAFPGGKVDPADAGPVEAALREAREEIGLPASAVEPLGQIDAHETVTSFTVAPVLGHVWRDFTPLPEIGEVEEVFEVPFDFLMNPAKLMIQSRRWQGVDRRYYVIPYGPYYIWGATARMIKALSDRVNA